MGAPDLWERDATIDAGPGAKVAWDSMPFARGTLKPPGSGRQKGTPNRATAEVSERLTELGCDPIEGMASIAANETNPPELRGRMYAELAQYVYPKRKAVEHTGQCGEVVVQVCYEEKAPKA